MLDRHPPWLAGVFALAIASAAVAPPVTAQGVTTAAISGIVTDSSGTPLETAHVTAVHLPTGTSYLGITRAGGAYTILNMRVGGPYRVTAALIGYQPGTERDVQLSLGQNRRLDFRLEPQAVQVTGIEVVATRDPVLNADRTGAATFIDPDAIAALPTIKRSTRDLTRLDPRSDGNYAFDGRNWLYNNISVDGSYFNNTFGLDDPAPGGQTNAEPLPFDAVEQVQVSLAPFDVRQGGFTGANVNMVTRSGSNQVRGTAYTFWRNDALQGNTEGGQKVSAHPDNNYVQSGFSISGPLVRDRLFIYLNAEIERVREPGSDFTACTTVCTGTLPLGVSRVRADTMDLIRQRMIAVYNYDPGPYQDYNFHTDNNKVLARLDWNINAHHNLTFRYNLLGAGRDLGPHPFVLSYANAGRGPDATTLPFRNSGYRINNNLNSFALELNSQYTRWANRFFASYNRSRDYRSPFSAPFPTIDIGEGGVGYTTIGHEPFSIHNILNTDVLQFTDELSFFRGRHTFTIGANFERYSFFNSFNLFRYGVFFLPYGVASGAEFSSPAAFLAAINSGTPPNFASSVGTGPYKGEDIAAGQYSVYVQDEFPVTPRFSLTAGVRSDMPTYFTTPVDNPFSRGLNALDQNGNREVVDQSKLPGTQVMLSPRVGFNWNAVGDRATQVRGGTGVFTGRVPFVWVGNVISNPGANPNIWAAGNTGVGQVHTGSASDSSILQQSFDLNAMAPNFKWPQVWTTDLAVDHRLPWALLGTLELVYSKDLNAVYMRNADLRASVGTNPVDGRPFYGACSFTSCPSTATSPSLNPANGGAGIYVIDNTHQGYSYSVTAQLRRSFGPSVSASLGYTYLQARNNLKSTEIASVLWQNQPVQGNPNRPELSYSEFGPTHRIVGSATYNHTWSSQMRTQVGAFLEVTQGNRFSGAGGNRYSFIYSGDVNGDGYGGNDLIYIPRSQGEITFDACATACGTNVTPAQQWAALDAFIKQDSYLNSHRGQIAQRFGEINPWYHEVDLRILHELGPLGANRLQLSLDILNLTNLLNSDWGVRKVALATATSPLTLTGFDPNGTPHFNFTGPDHTFVNDPSPFSRWRMQLGVKYLFN